MDNRKEMQCPNHGLVLARQKTWPPYLIWPLIILSGFQFDLAYPFRCPKCGRLTE